MRIIKKKNASNDSIDSIKTKRLLSYYRGVEIYKRFFFYVIFFQENYLIDRVSFFLPFFSFKQEIFI